MLYTKYRYKSDSITGTQRLIWGWNTPAGLLASTSGTRAPTTVKLRVRGGCTLFQLGLGVRYLCPGAHCFVLLGMAFVEAQK